MRLGILKEFYSSGTPSSRPLTGALELGAFLVPGCLELGAFAEGDLFHETI
jgi:hypothetical protein